MVAVVTLGISCWAQVWVHPKYGNRMDSGMERRVREAIKAQQARTSASFFMGYTSRVT